MTTYALVSRGEREAINEWKVGLLGSDRHVMSTTRELDDPAAIAFCSLGVTSASGMWDLKSEKIFPCPHKSPEPER